jgi:hypothetical protein
VVFGIPTWLYVGKTVSVPGTDRDGKKPVRVEK